MKSFVMTLSLSILILISAKAQECVTSPVITCPQTFFGCGSDDITPEAIGFATAVPGDSNCPEPFITYEDEVLENQPCTSQRLIKRTWTADYPENTNPWLVAECTQTIILSDNEAPTIVNCPADIILTPGEGCQVIATWTPPTATDDCGIASFTSNIQPGVALEPGVTVVTYTAVDECGKTSTCSFNITVENVCCIGLPTIEIPGLFIGCPSADISPSVTGFATAVGTGSGTVSCTTPFVTFDDSFVQNQPCLVEVERVWTATNANFSDQSVSGTQTIMLEDIEAPVLSACPADITVSADAFCQQTVTWTAPTAMDNCGLASIVSSVGSNTATFDIGQHTVTYTATDNCGLQSKCSFMVIVEGVDLVLDCPPPFFGCPNTSINPTTTGFATLATNVSCDVEITFTDADVSQNGCAGSREIDRTWTATRTVDGATTFCVQRISLQDNQAPIINNCPSDIRVSAEPNCLATVSWTPPSASDNCAIASFSSNFGSNSGVFELGQHTVTYTAVDNCGNITTCSFLVIVEGGCCTDDVILSCPPVFTGCPGSSLEPSVTGMATSSGTADCPVDITFTDAVVSSGPCTGETVIDRTWVATRVSDGLAESCVQRINLIDDVDPILSNCPTGITVTADNGCQATVTWTAPTATDDCGLASLVSSTGSNSGVFGVGSHTVTYTATDNCGNIATCSFSVTVLGQAPSITCPPSYEGCPGSSIDPSSAGMAISDNDCSVNITFTDQVVSQLACSGSRIIERTWVATNVSDGATATCVQTISLVDREAPVINNCPSDIRVTADASCSAFVSWNVPTVSDNCGIRSFATNFGANSGFFGVGIHQIGYLAIDNCGQVSRCSFLIIVEGGCCTQNLTINCPADFDACPGSSIDPSVTGQASSTGTTECPTDITFTDTEVSTGACTGERIIDRKWTATRASDGATISCTQRISLIDDQGPTITNCPADMVVTADASCQATVSWTAPTATDDCGLQSFVSSTGSNSGVFSVGTHTVTYTATDNCGNQSTCSFSIVVSGPALSITCPADFVGCPGDATDPSVTGSASAAGTNGCSVEVSFTDVIVSTGSCQGVMEINRTWAAVRPSDGTTTSCIQRISIVDAAPPVISNCPADITVSADASCSATVSWTPPTASDDCGIASFGNNTGANSGVFSPGQHTITYTAVDNCGQITTCSFTITVEGGCCTQDITITCPGDFTGCPGSSIDPSVTGQATSSGTSSCPVDITFTDTEVSVGPCTSQRVIDRTWVATRTSDGLSASCVQRISLVDTSAPVLSNCPADITVSAGAECQATVSWTAPAVSDNCGIQNLVSSTGSNSGVFGVGTHTVTYMATDNCGNTSSCSFTVTVTGAAGMSLSCPATFIGCPGSSTDPSITGMATTSSSGQCGTADITFTDVVVARGACTGVEEIDRTWVATRPSDGVSTSCVQRIRLIDSGPPVISGCPSDIVVTADASCQAAVTWIDPTATDNCGLASFTSTGGAAGSFFAVGQHTITYTAIDNCGNTSTCSFLITVEGACCNNDVTINCPAAFTACPGTSTDPSVTGMATSTGTAACPIDITFSDVQLTQGGCSGSVEIDRTWTATRVADGVSSSCVQRITLRDTQAPSISGCPANITVAAGDNCQATVTWTAPTATDNCAVASLVSSTGSNSGVFGVGSHTVTYTATDNCGLVATCSFIVTVQGGCCTADVAISCPPTFEGCPGSSIDPSVTGMASSTSSAACPIDITFSDVQLTQGGCSGSVEIDRTWTATRVADGVSSSCVQRITLRDTQAPSISGCPANITVAAGDNCQATVTWTAPTATDNCAVASLVSSTGSNSGVFGVGSHTVTYTATDNCGLVTTCSFIVTVQGGCCTADVAISCPPTFEGCPGSSIDPSVTGMATSPSSASCNIDITFTDNILSTGTTCATSRVIDRVWVATRVNDGVTASCVQRINLTDNTSPSITACVPDVTLSFEDRTYTWNNPSVNDACGNLSFSYSVAQGTTFPVGTTSVNATVTDGCGNTTTCTFAVTVEAEGGDSGSGTGGSGGTGSGLVVSCSEDIRIDCGSSQKGGIPLPQVSTDCDICQGAEIPGFVFMGARDGKRYYCSKDRMLWPDARAFCEASGGQLAIINDASENAFLAHVLQASSAYIGLSDFEREGDFRWVDGSRISYSRWFPGQPNNYKNFQDYVELMRNGFWNDQTNNKALEFIMEIECLNITQTSGPTDLSQVDANTVVSFRIEDACGNIETCSYNITTVDRDVSLSCPDDIDISSSNNSEVVYFDTPDFMTCCDQCSLGAAIPGFVFMGTRNGSYYYCSKERSTWPQANRIARGLGGNLAIIEDAGENYFLSKLLVNQVAFIGISDHAEEGVWRDVNGNRQQYFNWRANNPNNFQGSQHYVELEPSGVWNDNTATYLREFIIEIKGCNRVKQVAGLVSGSSFPQGNTTVTFQGSDGCGNVETCSFNVNIRSNSNNQASYCASGGTISSRAFINSVQFNQTIFKSGDNRGYVNVKSPCVSLSEGSKFRLTITPGFGSFQFQAHYGMWIDYNGDGDFSDAGEFVARGKSAKAITGEIQVPFNTVRRATRMRIAMSLTGDPASCGGFLYGETEDYCIVLSGGSSGSSTGKTTGKDLLVTFEDLNRLEPSQFSIYPNPASDEIFLADNLEIKELRVYGIGGKLVRSYNNPGHRLDISELEKGLYLLRMIDNEGLEITEKLIKQ